MPLETKTSLAFLLDNTAYLVHVHPDNFVFYTAAVDPFFDFIQRLVTMLKDFRMSTT